MLYFDKQLKNVRVRGEERRRGWSEGVRKGGGSCEKRMGRFMTVDRVSDRRERKGAGRERDDDGGE